MRNIDLDSLEIFKAVVDVGSVVKAAAHLNRVPSNVTTRIKNLEERLGVQLFQRYGGKLTPSAEGELLLGYADRLLRIATEAELAMRRAKPQGVLRIGTLESTAAARLPPLLAAFHQRYPDVQIEMVTGTSTALIARIHRYEIEAAFVSEPFQLADVETQPMFTEDLVLIASKNAKHVETARDLQGCTIVAFATGCSYRTIFERWLTTIGVMPTRILELGSYHAIVACVAAGSGVGIVPRSVLRAVHTETEVKILPLPADVALTRTHLVWRAGHRSLSLDAFKKEIALFSAPTESARAVAAEDPSFEATAAS
ncbi:LysR family transcriptional regulator [Bordetella genomosp. 12]|uniref:LysR family transcriptional regulator n=1 Tax=Bordetella genomosp. 12 TaxID=463035 RepID=A0A261VE19_9BORD|nr:LysR family transcriptional regulator [Bordetella genomosp. 12]OZI71413.1 LysR family transcriptional regulator [Bordetella genomosp. 12]